MTTTMMTTVKKDITKGKDIEPFIVENAVNSCYIDSLLMGLFYKKSVIEKILSMEPKNPLGIYIQECIKVHFVDEVRDHKSVMEDTMNMIRLACFQTGWRSEDEFDEQQDVSEFYDFLANLFDAPQVQIQRKMMLDDISKAHVVDGDTESTSVEKIPYVALSLPEKTSKDVTVKELFDQWLYDNCANVKKDVVTEKGHEKKVVNGLNIYNLINTPYLISFGINRFKNEKERNDTNVIILKKISQVVKSNYLFQCQWEFHSAICFRGKSTKSGHYYTLIYDNNKYFIFDDLKIPCMYEVDMADRSVTDKIKKECVFLIYKLD